MEKTGYGIDYLYPLKKGFQIASNAYRKGDKIARPLEYGEIHYGRHNYTGPGTRIDLYPNTQPFNNIDDCSRTHDFEYNDASKEKDQKKRAILIRKADEKAIKCYDKYPNENGYIAAKLGINSKMKLENTFPIVLRSIAPNYSGKGLDMYDKCILDAEKSIKDDILNSKEYIELLEKKTKHYLKKIKNKKNKNIL